MSLRTSCRKALASVPIVDAWFRRFVWSRIHYPEVEMRFINELAPGSVDVAIDVGAALGAYSWLMNRVSKTVVAFEPGSVHYKYLKRAVIASRIEVVNAALGTYTGLGLLMTPGFDETARHSATLSTQNPAAGTAMASATSVSVLSLDEFFSAQRFEERSIDLLKIDVEGYELQVLEGAINTLSTHHPLIVCEIEARHNPNYMEVFELLHSLGYFCYIFRDGAYRRFEIDTLEHIQGPEELRMRLSPGYDARVNSYTNNFVFQMLSSRIKVAP